MSRLSKILRVYVRSQDQRVLSVFENSTGYIAADAFASWKSGMAQDKICHSLTRASTSNGEKVMLRDVAGAPTSFP